MDKTYITQIVRYVLIAIFSWFAAHGWLSAEQNTFISQYADAIVGALIVLGTVAWGLFVRPSSKAMEVAKQVDKQVPPSSQVVIKTPANKPDIVVQPK